MGKKIIFYLCLSIFFSGCAAKNIEELKNNPSFTYSGTSPCSIESTAYGVIDFIREENGHKLNCLYRPQKKQYDCTFPMSTPNGGEFFLLTINENSSGSSKIEAFTWFKGVWPSIFERLDIEAANGALCKRAE